MPLLNRDQITEIADALDALNEEFVSRDFDQDAITAILTTAAGHVIGTALMRAPVQQAWIPYGPDFGPGNASQVQSTMSFNTHGDTYEEIIFDALARGREFYGEDAQLAVTPGPVMRNPGPGPGKWASSVIVRLEGRKQPRHPVRNTDEMPG